MDAAGLAGVRGRRVARDLGIGPVGDDLGHPRRSGGHGGVHDGTAGGRRPPARQRLGRATATSAAAYALVTAGWLAVVGLIYSGGGHERFEKLASASPFFGPGQLAFETGAPSTRIVSCYGYLPVWMCVYFVTAFVLYRLALKTFDQCLGRVQDSRPRYAATRVFEESASASAPLAALGSRRHEE